MVTETNMPFSYERYDTVLVRRQICITTETSEVYGGIETVQDIVSALNHIKSYDRTPTSVLIPEKLYKILQNKTSQSLLSKELNMPVGIIPEKEVRKYQPYPRKALYDDEVAIFYDENTKRSNDKWDKRKDC